MSTNSLQNYVFLFDKTNLVSVFVGQVGRVRQVRKER